MDRIGSLLEPGELGRASEDQLVGQVALALDVDRTASDALWDDLWSEYLGTLNARLLDYVSRFRPTLKVGLLSNSFVGAREREEAAYAFSRHVDVIVYSHEHGLKKPDPSFYLLACKQLAVQPADVVFIDDHQICVEVARALGMIGIRFRTEDETIAAIEQALGRDCRSRGGRLHPRAAPAGVTQQARSGDG